MYLVTREMCRCVQNLLDGLDKLDRNILYVLAGINVLAATGVSSVKNIFIFGATL